MFTIVVNAIDFNMIYRAASNGMNCFSSGKTIENECVFFQTSGKAFEQCRLNRLYKDYTVQFSIYLVSKKNHEFRITKYLLCLTDHTFLDSNMQ
jgi:hypothetical protein